MYIIEKDLDCMATFPADSYYDYGLAVRQKLHASISI